MKKLVLIPFIFISSILYGATTPVRSGDGIAFTIVDSSLTFNVDGSVVRTSTPMAGDVTGTIGATIVGNDSHTHADSTVILSSAANWNTAYSWGDHVQFKVSPSSGIIDGQLADGVVISTKNIVATGTPSASTYLNGVGAWATPSGSGDMVQAVQGLEIGASTQTIRVDLTAIQISTPSAASRATWDNAASFVSSTPTWTSKSSYGLSETTVGSGIDIDRMNNHYAGVMYSVPAFSDNGNGTLTVALSSVSIYSNANFENGYYLKSVPQAILTPTDGEVSYVVVNWNSGTPEYQIVTLSNRATINQSNIIPIWRVFRRGTGISYSVNYGILSKGLPNKEADRMIRLRGIERESGLQLSEYGGRNIKVEAGYMWFGVQRYTQTVFQSTDTVNCHTEFWIHQSGNWVEISSDSYNNLWYDNGTSTDTVGVGKVVTNWVYRRIGAIEVDIILGTESSDSLTTALTRTEPSSKPPHLDYFYKLVGRILVVRGASTATVQTIVDTTLSSQYDSDHLNLSNIGTLTHAQLEANITAIQVSTVTIGVGATNAAAGNHAHSGVYAVIGDTLTVGVQVQAYDADLDDLADGSLTGSKVGDGVPAANIAAGSLDSDVIVSSLAVNAVYPASVRTGSYNIESATVDEIVIGACFQVYGATTTAGVKAIQVSPIRDYAMTITTMTITVIGGTSVSGMIEQRAVNAQASAGTDVWSGDVTAVTTHIGGEFADATVPANYALYFIPTTWIGAVDSVIFYGKASRD
jgi:hypothetical protein